MFDLGSISRSLVVPLSLLVLASLSACDGDPGAGAGDSGQTLSFQKDDAPVAVDFRKWGTPAYYQRTAVGWTLAVVANEVSGTAKRYVSVIVRALDDNELIVAEYPCTAETSGPKVSGQITYAEDGMNRVWKQAAGSPCKIAITEIGALGAHLKGTFSATLKPNKGATEDVIVTNGVFDVVRKEY